MGVNDNVYSPEMLVDLLPQYYKRLFPFQQYTRWMQYGNIDKNYMANREFSFTLEDDIYLRYLSFSNQEEFEAEMIKKCPHKIDIGAVYNARPTDHKKLTNFVPQERELGEKNGSIVELIRYYMCNRVIHLKDSNKSVASYV